MENATLSGQIFDGLISGGDLNDSYFIDYHYDLNAWGFSIEDAQYVHNDPWASNVYIGLDAVTDYTSNLNANYEMNGNVLDSANSYDGVVVGSVSFSPWLMGDGADFPGGNNNCINVPKDSINTAGGTSQSDGRSNRISFL